MIINDEISSNGKFYNRSKDSFNKPESSEEKSMIVRDLEIGPEGAPISFADQLNRMDDEALENELGGEGEEEPEE